MLRRCPSCLAESVPNVHEIVRNVNGVLAQRCKLLLESFHLSTCMRMCEPRVVPLFHMCFFVAFKQTFLAPCEALHFLKILKRVKIPLNTQKPQALEQIFV